MYRMTKTMTRAGVLSIDAMRSATISVNATKQMRRSATPAWKNHRMRIHTGVRWWCWCGRWFSPERSGLYVGAIMQ
jgi:hypothetical protein